jgi:RND family efflux transporter MFP subunit
MRDLWKDNAIEQRLLDEAKAHYEASVETELAAREAIAANKANIVAKQAQIEQALADVEAADAQVEVTQAELEKVQVQVEFATIHAPFDGVITTRSVVVNDFVRAANEGSNSEPLFTVNRIDKFRVVVLIPDRDVPFTDVGDLAEVEIDSLPSQKFPGKVSRKAESLDPQTRLMRVEIDLPNPTGKLKQGMYGHVSIILDRERDLMSVPTSCLLALDSDGKSSPGMSNLRWDIPTKQVAARVGDAAAVFVVRDGRAQLVPIRLGTNTGLRAAVLSGLNANDQVVLNPPQSLVEGARVTPMLRDE